MILFRNIQVLALGLLSFMLLTGCGHAGNAKSKDDASSFKKLNNTESIIHLTDQSTKLSKVQDELDKAKKAGQAVFVIVTGNGSADTEKAATIANSAAVQVKNSVIVELNRDITENAELVTKWGLMDAPLPLILVVSPKGYPTGGYILQQATTENLVELIPSPKMDDIYEALNDGNAAFLVITGKSFNDRPQVISNCKAAIDKMKGKAVIVELDRDDPKETKFYNQLDLPERPNTTSTLVINAQGQTTELFEGPVDSGRLMLAAYKVVQGGGGCCPSSR